MKKTNILSLLLVLFGFALVTGCTPNTDTPEVPEETTYTVTIASGIENGTVSTDKTSAKAGETVKLTVTPNDGYQLGSLTVVDSSSNAITTTSNTFTMPESNVTVDATFTEIPKVEYTVTYSSEYGTAPASITVTENTVLTAEQLPELSTEGKTFGGWFDGDTKAEAGKYTVTKTVTLTARWDVNTYTVTFNTNGGNSVKSKTVTYGGKVEKTADPTKAETDTERYSFAYWYTSDKPDSAFDFNTEIKADITLYAKWNTTVLYSISITSSANGAVTASKTSKIVAGEIITLTVTSDEGYEFVTLSVKNGDTKIDVTQDSSDVTKYTFTMPAGNVTVSATFTEIVKEYYVKFYSRNTGKEFTDIKKTVLQNALGVNSNYSNEKYTIYGVTPNGDELKELFNLIKYLARYGNDGFSASSALPKSGYDILLQLSLVEIENNSIIKIYFDTIVTPSMTMATR